MSCKSCMQLFVKLFNLLIFVVGVAMILYSIWMLREWKENVGTAEHLSKGTIGSESDGMAAPKVLFLDHQTGKTRDTQIRRPLLFFQSYGNQLSLPAPWFIYVFMGVGILVCLISFSGYVAAEASSGCCLCCYSVSLALLLMAQATLAAILFLDHTWKEDIPKDATGEISTLTDFVEGHLQFSKWITVGVIILQGLALLFAMILRAMVGDFGRTYDSDDDYIAPRPSYRQPVMSRQGTQGTNGIPAESRPLRNDQWGGRLKDKYGINTATEFSYTPESRRLLPQPPASESEEKKDSCTIM